MVFFSKINETSFVTSSPSLELISSKIIFFYLNFKIHKVKSQPNSQQKNPMQTKKKILK